MSKSLTVKEVRARVEKISQERRDFEIAHAHEKDLFVDVLRAIGAGQSNGRKLAQEALKSTLIDFLRVFA